MSDPGDTSVRELPPPALLVDAKADLGEGPVWDGRTGRLVWVDIEEGRLPSTDPASGETVNRQLPRSIGGTASLYRLETDLSVTRFLDGVTISNGLGWSPDGATCYYLDAPTMCIFAFDYDVASGAMSRRRVFAELPPGEGCPDGLCVDQEGAVWVALWPGWSVRRYLAHGRLDAVLPLPVSHVSSYMFGGPDLDRLFITSARTGLSPDELALQPLAGGLFVTSVGVRGLPRTSFAG